MKKTFYHHSALAMQHMTQATPKRPPRAYCHASGKPTETIEPGTDLIRLLCTRMPRTSWCPSSSLCNFSSSAQPPWTFSLSSCPFVCHRSVDTDSVLSLDLRARANSTPLIFLVCFTAREVKCRCLTNLQSSKRWNSEYPRSILGISDSVPRGLVP
jgi:hypothetical protein